MATLLKPHSDGRGRNCCRIPRRFAVRAIRASLANRIRAELPEVEKLYVEELMATADANEGVRAFLGKRRPIWKNR